ncbi:MAG TPA: DUF1549 domain-containing protein [Pirellulaceae bacterium]|nr:DUF1549 domain-containing protein [Pirellulaceae bacterium]
MAIRTSVRASFLVFAIGFAGHAGRLAAEEVDFAHEIVPLLKARCAECHSGEERSGGFSIDGRESFLGGGETGVAAVAGKSGESELVVRISSDDDSIRMPPEGDPLTVEQVALVRRWIDEGAKWEPGFTFGPSSCDPPLKPRMPELPPAFASREHPIDRILDAYSIARGEQPPPPVDDETFLRRASLDLVGLLPTPEEREAFLGDPSPDKRERLVRSLLAREVDYAEHWLTFWNDLLRNDYAGTGFITGGRTQISKWLYDSLVTNKPYDQFARELIAPPTPESSGFADGIRWRGEVSAGQTVEIQYAQSVGQTFLGINLKCASCHDSFIDRWKLTDAFGLAAVYSQRPLELHRCDKPTGETAQAAWLFPELGQIDAAAPQPERLKQLAGLMTHRENGRFTRTIVNRLWHRLIGRGIVHPVDAMQSEPWSADLLDYLAEDLVANGYDLKKTIERIATSEAYRSQAESVREETDVDGYAYAGPRSKRLTAEQFVDAVRQLTQTGPEKFDAPVVRGTPDADAANVKPLSGAWIWNRADVSAVAVGEKLAFRKEWKLAEPSASAIAAVTCDNAYTLYVNGKRIHRGENWAAPDLLPLSNLKKGANEILIVAENAGSSPGPAGLFFEARWSGADGKTGSIATDETWEWSAQLPDKNGKYKQPPKDWKLAAKVAEPQVWMSKLEPELKRGLSRQDSASRAMVRASLLKSDYLMRSLGRPNRDQIVSVRPLELTTLEAIDLSNGEALADILRRGAATLRNREWKSPEDFIEWTYRFALSREPTEAERQTLAEIIDPELTTEGIEDVLWAVIMLPEFQLVR